MVPEAVVVVLTVSKLSCRGYGVGVMVSGVVVWRSAVSRLSCRDGWEGLLGGEGRCEEYDGWWFRRRERSLVRTERTMELKDWVGCRRIEVRCVEAIVSGWVGGAAGR